MHGLASSFTNLGLKKEAAQLYKGTLQLRSKILGPVHPHTRLTRDKLVALIDANVDEQLAYREECNNTTYIVTLKVAKEKVQNDEGQVEGEGSSDASDLRERSQRATSSANLN
jgi:hypothetical protein